MADQTVRIENMADSGSKEAVALAIFRLLRSPVSTKEEQLALYAECLQIVAGNKPSYAAAHAKS